MKLTAAQLPFLVIREASRFVGLREVKQNREWDNPATEGRDDELVKELLRIMRPAPWEDGWAYCAAFVEGVIANVLAREGLTEDVKRWRRLMTAGVLQSFENFDRLGLVSHTPEVGSVWLARHGSTRNGHCGIVTHCEPKRMLIGTIEANTSLDSLDPAKDREGDWITTRLSAMRGRGELKTLGFISPRAMLPL